jgi:hypothetical protein
MVKLEEGLVAVVFGLRFEGMGTGGHIHFSRGST